jgi:predicted lipoprotein with Yx(FWY)xxD motif
MASPPASTKTSLGQKLRERARQRWPQLAGIGVRFRGQFAYVTGQLPDGTELPLCRLRYVGYASTWGFAIYRASHDDYQDNYLPSGQPSGTPEETLDCACGLYLGDPTAWLTPPSTDTPTDLQAGALVLFGLVVAGASSPAPAATSTGLKTMTIGGITVLTNAKGFTLYSFAPDTPTTSKCYGSCAVYWPPVTGTAAASPGVPGRVGTIKRTDGSDQLTYNGHRLYTYIGDTAPGQARGNNLDLNGGLWHEVPASG